MAMKKHWAADYIGKPYSPGGEYDCWTLFAHIQQKHFARQVPTIAVADYDTITVRDIFKTQAQAQVGKWRQISQYELRNGCGVLLAQLREPHHIGVWINDGVLHCTQAFGVIFTHTDTLALSQWRIVGAYDYDD